MNNRIHCQDFKIDTYSGYLFKSELPHFKIPSLTYNNVNPKWIGCYCCPSTAIAGIAKMIKDKEIQNSKENKDDIINKQDKKDFLVQMFQASLYRTDKQSDFDHVIIPAPDYTELKIFGGSKTHNEWMDPEEIRVQCEIYRQNYDFTHGKLGALMNGNIPLYDELGKLQIIELEKNPVKEWNVVPCNWDTIFPLTVDQKKAIRSNLCITKNKDGTLVKNEDVIEDFYGESRTEIMSRGMRPTLRRLRELLADKDNNGKITKLPCSILINFPYSKNNCDTFVISTQKGNAEQQCLFNNTTYNKAAAYALGYHELLKTVGSGNWHKEIVLNDDEIKEPEINNEKIHQDYISGDSLPGINNARVLVIQKKNKPSSIQLKEERNRQRLAAIEKKNLEKHEKNKLKMIKKKDKQYERMMLKEIEKANKSENRKVLKRTRRRKNLYRDNTPEIKDLVEEPITKKSKNNSDTQPI